LRARLVYGRDEPAAGSDDSLEGPVRQALLHGAPRPARLPATPAYAATGLIYKPARWRGAGPEALIGEVEPCSAADLWTTPFVPASRLPVAHLEAIVRASLATAAPPARARRLVVARLRLFPGRPPCRAVVGWPAERRWCVVDEARQIRALFEGVAYENEYEQEP
jgi:hypothetical protein